jgi:hypothetical protein
LITEGYVSEYGDGRLFIPLAQPAPKPKPSKPGESSAKAADPIQDTTALADEAPDVDGLPAS